jgi:Prokaryotic cytochrome b561
MTEDRNQGSWPDPGGGYQPSRPSRQVQSPPPAEPSPPARRSGGAEGNERLTAITGAVLLVLLAVEGYTILRIGRLLTLHFFLGMLLLGPVTLKAASVMYRFARYYAGSEPYRRKGPPQPLLRVLGPIIVLLTVCVFGSGIMLAVTGPSYMGPSEWLTLHRLSFIAWLCAMTVHVLTYVWHLPRLLTAEARGISLAEGKTGGHGGAGRHARRAMEVLGGRGTRLALLITSLLAGLVIALLTVHLAGQWQ